MLRLDLQFYAFFTVVLAGAVLGLLFDLLRVVVRRGRLGYLASAVADLLFWSVATVALSGALFYGNWGEVRIYVVVGLLVGLGLYYWLASPFMTWLFDLFLGILAWLVDLCITLFLRLVWAPLLALVHLLLVIGRWIFRVLGFVAQWLLRPLVGPYRCLKLKYLRMKRRLRRLFRF